MLDAEALTNVCKQCQLHSDMDKESVEYHSWKADHINCKANFDGSAPAMESEGTQRIFARSIENNMARNRGHPADRGCGLIICAFRQIQDGCSFLQ